MFDSFPKAEPLLGWRDVMEKLRPKVEKALRLGRNAYSFDDLCLAVERSRLKLFYRQDALLFCEVTLFPQYPVLTVVLVAGDLKGVRQLDDAVCQWGRMMGCSRAIAFARPGWSKYGNGWNVLPKVMIEKDLTDVR
jgi:hypothetical protein